MRLVEDPGLTAATNEFVRGVPLPLVRYHFDRGELEEAAAVARLALNMPDCPDADAIEEILDRCSAPPDDWNVFERRARRRRFERKPTPAERATHVARR